MIQSGTELWALATLLALPLVLTALTALLSRGTLQFLPAHLQTYLTKASFPDPANETAAIEPVHPSCESHKYTSEIVSLDPLVIYINNFTSFQEAEDLIKLGYVDPPSQPSYLH